MNKIIDKNPGFVEAKLTLGRIYLIERKHKKAILLFKKSIKENPNSIKSYYFLASVYQRMGKLNKTREYLKKVIKKFSHSKKQIVQNYLKIVKLKLDVIEYKLKLNAKKTKKNHD